MTEKRNQQIERIIELVEKQNQDLIKRNQKLEGCSKTIRNELDDPRKCLSNYKYKMY